MLLEAMNTHSLLWNLYYKKKINTKSLEELIEKFYLLINNKLDRSTKLINRKVFIIYLVLSTIKLSPLLL